MRLLSSNVFLQHLDDLDPVRARILPPGIQSFKSQLHLSQILPPSWVANTQHILSAKSSGFEMFPIPGSQTQTKSP